MACKCPKRNDIHVLPSSAARARMYSHCQSIIGPFSTWPEPVLRAFLKNNRDFFDRRLLFKYFFCHGATSGQIRYWLLFNDYGPDNKGPSISERKHVRCMLVTAKRNPDFYFKNQEIFDESI